MPAAAGSSTRPGAPGVRKGPIVQRNGVKGEPGRDIKPTLPERNHGEEEWAELIKGSMGGGKEDWYAKGVKSVEVSDWFFPSLWCR